MDDALAQYNLTEWEVIIEPKTDSKALLAGIQTHWWWHSKELAVWRMLKQILM